MNYSANINGIEYSVSYSDTLVNSSLIPLLRHLSQLHTEKGSRVIVMLAAPTRSGKGVGIVIPNCITYTGSLVVLDIKLENFDITAGYRQAPKEKGGLGQEVYLFAPFDPNGRTHRWNPISYISEDPSNRMGDIDAIANALYNNPNAKDPFWDNMAKDMFRACCLAVIETPENLKPHTLGQIIREASAGIDNLKFLLDARMALVYEDGHIKRDKDGNAIEAREAGPQAAPKEGAKRNSRATRKRSQNRRQTRTRRTGKSRRTITIPTPAAAPSSA